MPHKTVRYTVKTGDTISSIAQDILGDGSRWYEIAELNRIQNPSVINVGQVLEIDKEIHTSTHTLA
jgi:nucleoid-associated protein YgaU